MQPVHQFISSWQKEDRPEGLSDDVLETLLNAIRPVADEHERLRKEGGGSQSDRDKLTVINGLPYLIMKLKYPYITDDQYDSYASYCLRPKFLRKWYFDSIPVK